MRFREIIVVSVCCWLEVRPLEAMTLVTLETRSAELEFRKRALPRVVTFHALASYAFSFASFAYRTTT